MESRSVLAVLLVISVLVNIWFAVGFVPSEQDQVSALIAKMNTLSIQNMQLQQQLAITNLSLQGSSCSLDFCRARLAAGGLGGPGFQAGNTGSATMIAPAVSQSVERIRNGPFIEQIVVMNGSVMNISVNAQPGRGRVLVETKPLMGIVFQDAANTAVFVARNRTRVNLNGTDILFSIQADKQISAVDGPSAGALMAVLSIAALEHRAIDPEVTLTGTIDENGHVGVIGGVVEKATAAKAHGITHFLIPRENSALTIYDQKTFNYRGFQLVDYVPRTVEAKSYIRDSVGISVDYIDSIDDVLAIALK